MTILRHTHTYTQTEKKRQRAWSGAKTAAKSKSKWKWKTAKKRDKFFLLRASKLMTIDKLSHSLMYACLCMPVCVCVGWVASECNGYLCECLQIHSPTQISPSPGSDSAVASDVALSVSVSLYLSICISASLLSVYLYLCLTIYVCTFLSVSSWTPCVSVFLYLSKSHSA